MKKFQKNSPRNFVKIQDKKFRKLKKIDISKN